MSDRERDNLIDILNRYHEEHNKQHEEFLERIGNIDNKVERVIEWQANSTPSIEVMKKMQGFSSVTSWIFKTILVIGGVATALWTVYNFFRVK